VTQENARLSFAARVYSGESDSGYVHVLNIPPELEDMKAMATAVARFVLAAALFGIQLIKLGLLEYIPVTMRHRAV
jgi:hypothetical protein